MTTGTERSSVLGGRRDEKARSERVAVERSKPVRQPLGMTDHRESNDAWVVPVGLTSRLIGGVDVSTVAITCIMLQLLGAIQIYVTLLDQI